MFCRVFAELAGTCRDFRFSRQVYSLTKFKKLGEGWLLSEPGIPVQARDKLLGFFGFVGLGVGLWE